MKKFLIALCLTGMTLAASAEELALAVPEMKVGMAIPEVKIELAVPELKLETASDAAGESRPRLSPDQSHLTTFASDRWAWRKTNPGVTPYKVMDDLTFVGIPLFAAGWAIKGEKNNFKQDSKTKASLLVDFKTSIDDYTQYFGPAMTLGLKIGGVEGRSDWSRLLVSSAMSYGIMAGLVNSIKYTAKEMRPDGTTANSWPSGHTATSFVGATILHKEYGLTRSPWYSVAGYGVATATGVMRILNNRHWISDVLSGAGIGIMSTEIAYALSDVIFKGKGLLRNDLQTGNESPSFFAVSMGMSWGLKNLNFGEEDLGNPEDAEDMDIEPFNVDFHTASVVDAEGAYFFNKYIGVGGRLRVRAMTAKSWSNYVDRAKSDRTELLDEVLSLVGDFSTLSPEYLREQAGSIMTSENYTIVSDHLTEFSASAGLYFNLPLSKRLSLGSKLLIGRSMTQELDINAQYQGDIKDIDYKMTIENGYVTSLEFSKFASSGKSYDDEWDYLTLGGSNSTMFGTGLSLTYRYKSNFSWRIYADYDYSEKDFTLTYDPYRFVKISIPNFTSFAETLNSNMNPIEYNKTKKTHIFSVGASFVVNF